MAVGTRDVNLVDPSTDVIRDPRPVGPIVLVLASRFPRVVPNNIHQYMSLKYRPWRASDTIQSRAWSSVRRPSVLAI